MKICTSVFTIRWYTHNMLFASPLFPTYVSRTYGRMYASGRLKIAASARIDSIKFFLANFRFSNFERKRHEPSWTATYAFVVIAANLSFRKFASVRRYSQTWYLYRGRTDVFTSDGSKIYVRMQTIDRYLLKRVERYLFSDALLTRSVFAMLGTNTPRHERSTCDVNNRARDMRQLRLD